MVAEEPQQKANLEGKLDGVHANPKLETPLKKEKEEAEFKTYSFRRRHDRLVNVFKDITPCPNSSIIYFGKMKAHIYNSSGVLWVASSLAEDPLEEGLIGSLNELKDRRENIIKGVFNKEEFRALRRGKREDLLGLGYTVIKAEMIYHPKALDVTSYVDLSHLEDGFLVNAKIHPKDAKVQKLLEKFKEGSIEIDDCILGSGLAHTNTNGGGYTPGRITIHDALKFHGMSLYGED